jgi:hypothetical protein
MWNFHVSARFCNANRAIVIPKECEGSKISPYGRNDKEDDFDVAM